MRKTLIIATAALALALSHCATATEAKPSGNEIVAGEVMSIDTEDNHIKVRSSDGILHEFEATKATLDDLKVGDRIEARKRAATK